LATHALSDFDRHLLGEGSHLRSYEQPGAHLGQRQGEAGVRFALWAPNASNGSTARITSAAW
jgi:1,4-alpha-glucan branching enzyme